MFGLKKNEHTTFLQKQFKIILMDSNAHKIELQQLFPDIKVETKSGEVYHEVKFNIKRELSRMELGHLFSLGMKEIKRSGEGLSITFDLMKASKNNIYKPEIL
jgi:hypothetical protein